MHCGHAKGNAFDESKVISPLAPDCEQRFIYSASNGAICPADKQDESAAQMVGLLRLDASFLRGRRSQAIGSAFDAEFVEAVSDADLEKLALAYREPDASGRLTGFGHVLARYAEQLLGHAV